MRFLFSADFSKEGPGIPKDAPPKTGLALFFEILVREFWQILKLNLLFVLSALPVITFGASRSALFACTVAMVRDVPNDVWFDFKQAFRKDFGANSKIGCVELFINGIIGAIGLLAVLQRSEWLALTAGILFGFFIVFWGYFWTMRNTVSLSVRVLVKNTFLLILLCPHHALPAAFMNLLLYILGFWLFPLSMPILVFIPFGIGGLVSSFAAWHDIKTYLLIEHGGSKHD